MSNFKLTIAELIANATAAGRALLTAADAAAQKVLLSLSKSDVGLGNVDNTSDANKPVSTAQAAAIAAKIGGSVGSTDNRLVKSSGTDTLTVQSTGITVDGSNNVSGVGTLACGAITASGLIATSGSANTYSLTLPNTVGIAARNAGNTAWNRIVNYTASNQCAVGDFDGGGGGLGLYGSGANSWAIASTGHITASGAFNITTTGNLACGAITASGTVTAGSFFNFGNASQFLRALPSWINVATYGGYGLGAPMFGFTNNPAIAPTLALRQNSATEVEINNGTVGTQRDLLVRNLSASGDLICSTAGKGLQVKSGTGARAGTAVLVAGTVTVTNTTVTASTRIFLTVLTTGGTLGTLSYTLSAGASFTINSSSVSDTSTVTYFLIEVN